MLFTAHHVTTVVLEVWFVAPLQFRFGPWWLGLFRFGPGLLLLIGWFSWWPWGGVLLELLWANWIAFLGLHSCMGFWPLLSFRTRLSTRTSVSSGMRGSVGELWLENVIFIYLSWWVRVGLRPLQDLPEQHDFEFSCTKVPKGKS